MYYEFINDKNIPAIIKKDGFSSPVWIQQRWQNGKYVKFVQKNGCGHCCTAMALNLHGIYIDPNKEFTLCRELWGKPDESINEYNFMSVRGIVKILSHFEVSAEAFGVSDAKKSAEHIYNELKDGNTVIFWSHPSEKLEPNPFSTGEHYVLAVGISDEGIVVANSSNKAITDNGIQTVDIDTIEKSLFVGTDPKDFTWGRTPCCHSGGYVIIKK